MDNGQVSYDYGQWLILPEIQNHKERFIRAVDDINLMLVSKITMVKSVIGDDDENFGRTPQSRTIDIMSTQYQLPQHGVQAIGISQELTL